MIERYESKPWGSSSIVASGVTEHIGVFQRREVFRDSRDMLQAVWGIF